jgi:hypothetical protein
VVLAVLAWRLVSSCRRAQVSGSGRKVTVGQTVGLLLRRGSLIAYRNGAMLGVLCDGLTGRLVWAADLYDTGSSVRIERKPVPAAAAAAAAAAATRSPTRGQ